jgi:hypothetical protein
MRFPSFAFVAFFLINFFFVSYLISVEPLTIPDVEVLKETGNYPLWPPKAFVQAEHKYWAANFDNLVLARPVFYKTYMWMEVLLFGPFYLVASIAIIKKKDWIRMPCIIYSSFMICKIFVLMAEGTFGQWKSPVPLVYNLAHSVYILIPAWIIAHCWYYEKPFSDPVAGRAKKKPKHK